MPGGGPRSTPRGAARLAVALVLGVGLLVTSCAAGPAAAPQPLVESSRTVVDHYGTETVIERADRVVTAYSAFSDAVFELGEGDRLVGVDNSADWPAGRVDAIPDIGMHSELNVEGIAALGADLFITSDRHMGLAKDLSVEQMEAAGISVLVLPEERWAKEQGGYSLAIIEDSVRLIAEALGVPAEGARVIETMRTEQQAAAAAASRQCKQWGVINYRAVGSGGALVTGRDSVGELFVELTGGKDLASEAGLEGFAEPEPEAVRALAPEVVFGLARHWAEGKDGVAFHRALPGLEGTPAAEAGRIFPVQNLSVATSWRLPGHARELAENLAELAC